MILHYRKFGAAGAPLFILHGLYGHHGNWTAHARLLSETFTVYALDARNHGQSGHARTMSYGEMAQDVCETMDALGIAQARFIGHSMGGKTAMMLALLHPGRVQSLVVVDIAPVAYPQADRHVLSGLQAIPLDTLESRHQADDILAARVDSKPVRDFLLSNLQRGADGVFTWRFNLAALVEHFGEITGWPRTGRQYPGKVLFIRGADSAYIQPAHQQATLAQFPSASMKTVQGAGHWVHSEKPDTFRKLALRFLLDNRD